MSENKNQSAILNLEFEKHFQAEFGPRWPELFAGLKQPPLQALRRNLFFTESAEKIQPGPALSQLNHCFVETGSKAENLAIKSEVFKYYLLDPASVMVAQSLPIKPGDRVLDMCAAPGGKSLILAEKLFANLDTPGGELVCNELSQPRRERLKYILQNYVPREKREGIYIKGIDGQLYGKREPEGYDAILLDAPCTGERHLLEDTSEFKKWTFKRSKNNAVRQFSLLSSAWHALKSGGYLMYSTCSISSAENDEVIKKLQGRRAIEVIRPKHLESITFIEKTEHGYQILPDKNWPTDSIAFSGAGPMFFSLIRRT